MSNKNLFQEAIADAKSVREAALANAKAALEEALTPRLQSMLAAKLNEMEYEEEGMTFEGEDEMEEGFNTNSFGWDEEDQVNEDLEGDLEDEEEDLDLSEILAELNEAKEEMEAEESEESEESEEEPEEEESEESEEEVEVKDLTIEELKDLIKDIVSQEMGAEEASNDDMDTEMGDMGTEDGEEEINLDELLAELDAMGNKDEKDDVTSALVANLSKALDKTKDDGLGGKLEKAVEDAIEKTTNESKGKNSINEYYNFGGGPEQLVINTLVAIMSVAGVSAGIVSALKGAVSLIKKSKEDKKAADAQSKEPINEYVNFGGGPEELIINALVAIISTAGLGAGIISAVKGAINQIKANRSEKKSEMKEAIATINTLRNELNEVNLLNAKLLYLNKIFKSKNLTESQKVHVIASFDKATNVKEAKVVFESLNTALVATKKPIKESLGFASKAAGIAPSKQPIVESNDAISRMQKLANIIK